MAGINIFKNSGTCNNLPGSFNCSCIEGWTGKDCSEDVNECSVSGINICKNNGTCNNLPGSFNCSCIEGWSGRDCSVDVDECSVAGINICKNSGTCNNLPGSFNCSCMEGWTGRDCSKDIDECSVSGINICKNNGTCNNLPGSFNCSCIEGWTGKDCSEDVNECSVSGINICKNNGTCNNLPGSFNCSCIEGWSGSDCSVDVNECSVAGNNICKNSGTCNNLPGSFNCSCIESWTGKDCSEDVNECSVSGINICKNYGTCNNLPGSFNCSCIEGWSGSDCSKDIDECSLSGNNICQNNGMCNNLPGSFNCSCIEGWSGSDCSKDIDECSVAGINICKNNGMCNNLPGSFNCSCIEGWTCRYCFEDDDECSDAGRNICKNNEFNESSERCQNKMTANFLHGAYICMWTSNFSRGEQKESKCFDFNGICLHLNMLLNSSSTNRLASRNGTSLIYVLGATSAIQTSKVFSCRQLILNYTFCDTCSERNSTENTFEIHAKKVWQILKTYNITRDMYTRFFSMAYVASDCKTHTGQCSLTIFTLHQFKCTSITFPVLYSCISGHDGSRCKCKHQFIKCNLTSVYNNSVTCYRSVIPIWLLKKSSSNGCQSNFEICTNDYCCLNWSSGCIFVHNTTEDHRQALVKQGQSTKSDTISKKGKLPVILGTTFGCLGILFASIAGFFIHHRFIR